MSDDGQSHIAGHMSIAIVILLEVIDIDDEDRQTAFLAGAAPPFERASLVEGTPIGQLRQLVDARQSLEMAGSGGELDFEFAAQSELTQKQEAERRKRRAQAQHHGAQSQRLLPPRRIDALLRHRIGDDQRKVRHAGGCV